ncbi:hypothetical protein ES703_104744 [subsurface metagenome]
MPWINEANWPEAWDAIVFSPIVRTGEGYIVYVTGGGIRKIYKYNLTTQTWTYLRATIHHNHGAISMSPDESKLALHTNNGQYLFIYDIAGNSLTQSAIAPVLDVTGEDAFIGTTVWTDNDTVWCHIRDGLDHGRNKCYKYVVSTDTWTQYANVYIMGPFDNRGYGMSVNSAGTALFVGGVHEPDTPTDRTKSYKYTIATDTYSFFRLTGHGYGGYNFNLSSDRNARLWFIDAVTPPPYATFYYDCDTESADYVNPVFPGDPLLDLSTQLRPRGFYEMGYVIGHNKAAEPKNRSYLITTPPSVTTDPATEVGAIAATLNGTLDDDGLLPCECGFEWGLDTGYGTTTPPQSKTTGETFSQVIGGLEPGTTYHFRAFATNSKGTGYGADRSFTTSLIISNAYALAREEL